MFSPYRISPNINYTRKQKTPNTNLDDVKMTSNDVKKTSKQTSNKTAKTMKNKLKGGAKIETNDKYLEEIVHKNSLQMKLAIKINSDDKN